MTATSGNFTFGENGVFEANVAAIFVHMGQKDAALAVELQISIHGIYP